MIRFVLVHFVFRPALAKQRCIPLYIKTTGSTTTLTQSSPPLFDLFRTLHIPPTVETLNRTHNAIQDLHRFGRGLQSVLLLPYFQSFPDLFFLRLSEPRCVCIPHPRRRGGRRPLRRESSSYKIFPSLPTEPASILGNSRSRTRGRSRSLLPHEGLVLRLNRVS